MSNKAVCVFLVLLGLVWVGCESGSQEPPPNVLFILVDDLGWKDLGSYGSEFYDTPNLDSLAGKAVRFTDAYSAHPVCSPTRAAIMSGKDPVRVGITDWIPGMPLEQATDPQLIPPEDNHHLALEEITIAEAFKEEGYKTFFAGKWHLGESPEYWPEHQGFDINKGGHDRGSPPGGYYAPYENPRLEDGPEGEYLTDRLASESIQFMENSADQQVPFFLFLSLYTVHTPIQGAEEFDAQYKEKQELLPEEGAPKTRKEGYGQTRLNQSNYKYAAMVRSMDKNVGRILVQLEALNLSDNTIIVFTSDNGGLSTLSSDRGMAPTAVTPLRAGKGWAYEGGIRVPLIIKAPELAEGIEGRISSQPAISMDLYPTLLELAGLERRPDQHLDGQSLVPYLKDPKRVDERTLVWHYPHYHGSAWRPGSAIRKGNWKLIEFYEGERIELYNLDKDIEEEHNLVEQHPEKAAGLRAEMHDYIEQRGGQYPQKK